MEMKDGVAAGAERLNAVIAWWGLPSATHPDAIDKNFKRWLTFATDVQKVVADAYGAEVKTGIDRADRVGQWFQAFMLCRQPNDFLAAQSQLVAVLHESASHRAKRLSDVTQSLHECCASMARDTADDFREQVSESEQPAAKAARPRASQA